jgi:glycosyltransferase involved in cell wall biosynthesis
MLIISLAKLHPKRKFILYFNGLALENSIQDIVQSFPSDLENIRFYISQVEIKNMGIQIEDLAILMTQEISEMDAEFFLALSVMEHPNNVLPLNPRLIKNSICILYDVIPLQFPEIFLEAPAAKTLYFENLSRLTSYSKIASISNKSIENLHRYCPDISNISPIYGAGFENTNHVAEGQAFSDRKGFIAVGSASPHKNLRNVISAYSDLPLEIRNSHPLHLVGVNESGEIKLLREFAQNLDCKVVIHDFLTDEELNSLYLSIRVAIAPAWEEGLGMPVFESWSSGAVCVGSMDTAVSEILGNSQVCFDPLDIDSIFAALMKYIDDEDAWTRERRRIRERIQTYSWNITAKLFSDFVNLS